MIRYWLFWLGLGVSIFAHGYEDSRQQAPVVVSIPPLALIVKEVVGELAPVKVLVAGSVNPHDYVLRPSDIQLLGAASAIYWIGPGVDGFLAKSLGDRAGETRLSEKSVALSLLDGLHWPDDHDVDPEHSVAGSNLDQHHHDGPDSHVWLNPQNASVIAAAVAKHLEGSGMFTATESQYMRQNAIAASERWAALLDTWQPRFAQHKHFSAYHQAYGHLAQAFKLSQDAIVTSTPEQQPGAKHLWELSQRLNKGQCLLVEPYYSKALPEKLQKTTGVKLVDVDLLAVNRAYTSYAQWLQQAVLTPLLNCLMNSPS